MNVAGESFDQPICVRQVHLRFLDHKDKQDFCPSPRHFCYSFHSCNNWSIKTNTDWHAHINTRIYYTQSRASAKYFHALFLFNLYLLSSLLR